MSPPRRKNVFLTGASSGIGRATAEVLVRNGYEVWGTSRSAARLSTTDIFHAVEMDLADPGSISRGWATALSAAENFDAVVQNAGSGIFGSIEEVSGEDSSRQWQVLVEGPRQILQLAAAHFRPRREGLIIGVSSLAAELPMPFSAHYSAGKAALSALLAGLAMELAPFQVKVVDLRPGDIKTAFNDELPKTLAQGSPYFPWADRTFAECSRLMREAPEPELIARGILRLLAEEHPPHVARMGTFFQAKLGPVGVRMLPLRALLKSIRRYYGLHKIDERERARD